MFLLQNFKALMKANLRSPDVLESPAQTGRVSPDYCVSFKYVAPMSNPLEPDSCHSQHQPSFIMREMAHALCPQDAEEISQLDFLLPPRIL
jgi:hypothetical protein